MGLWKGARGPHHPQQSPASPCGAPSPIPLPAGSEKEQPRGRRSSAQQGFSLPQAPRLILAVGIVAPFPPLPPEGGRGAPNRVHVRPLLAPHHPLSLADMVAVLGETTGCLALPSLRDKMRHHPEGYRILQCVPPHPHPSLSLICLSICPSTSPRRGLG